MTSRADVDARRAVLCRIAEENRPLSIRNAYYIAVSLGLVEKTERAYGVVQNDLVVLRRAGLVGLDWIVDASRVAAGQTASRTDLSMDELLAAHLRGAVADPGISPWAETGIRPAIVCESRSIAGMVATTADEYEIAVWPLGGYGSLSFTRDLAADRVDRIGYIGDLDPDGDQIRDSLTDHLVDDHHWTGFEFFDLAVTDEQVESMGLPTRPAKNTSRAASVGRWTAVEAEAIAAPTMRRIVEDWIESLQPDGWIGRWRARRGAASTAVADWADEHGVEL